MSFNIFESFQIKRELQCWSKIKFHVPVSQLVSAWEKELREMNKSPVYFFPCSTQGILRYWGYLQITFSLQTPFPDLISILQWQANVLCAVVGKGNRRWHFTYWFWYCMMMRLQIFFFVAVLMFGQLRPAVNSHSVNQHVIRGHHHRIKAVHHISGMAAGSDWTLLLLW